MPGIDQILETILSTARQESETVLAEARDRCDLIRRETEGFVTDAAADMEKTAARRCEEIDHRAQTQARLNQRRARLTVQQELITEVFDRARAALIALPDDRFTPFIERLMLRAVATGHEQVLTAPGERRIDAALIGRVNEALRAKGLPGGLTLAQEPAAIGGGFLLEEKGVLTNCSFEMLLRQLRGEVETDVVQALFPEGEA